MRGNANCSEMVTTLLRIVLYVSRLAKVIFNGRTVFYEIQVGSAFKTFLALQTYVTSVNHELALKPRCGYM